MADSEKIIAGLNAQLTEQFELSTKFAGHTSAMSRAIRAFFEVYDRDELLPLTDPQFDQPIDMMRAAIKDL